MSTILITGGAGNIGASLANKLAEDSGNLIVVIDNLLTGSITKLKLSQFHNIKFINADVNNFQDISSVFLFYHFDYVFHYSAVVGVKRTLENPILVLKDIDGIKNVLDLSKNTNVKRVFYSSSSEVYGEPFEVPQNETTTPLNSRLPYAIVKNLGEVYLKSYKQNYDLNYTIFRFFNTYGPLQSNDFVIPKFINAAINNEDIPINGNGDQTRTFCYIDDNIILTKNVLENDLCLNDTLNVGNEIEITILELAKLILKLIPTHSNIIHVPALKEGDMTRRKPDNTKMRSILGRNLLPLEDGIMKIYEHKLKSKSEQFYHKSLSKFI
jgi:UDP-glucuronate decarboxylase